MAYRRKNIFERLLSKIRAKKPKNKRERYQLYTKGKTHKEYSAEEKLSILKELEMQDVPVCVFAKWVGISATSIENWREAYQSQGEAGLVNKIHKKEHDLPEEVKARIIQLKKDNPQMGSPKIAEWLKRHDFVKVSKSAILYLLKSHPETKDLVAEAPKPKNRHEFEPQSFERSKPRQMYQMDITPWRLKGLYPVYIIGCIDDHSRFMVSWGVFRRQRSEQCIDVLRAAIEQHNCIPEEVLTDNGRQFYVWHGKKNKFQKFLQEMGIKHIKSRPYHPQTLGKIESFWRNMYKEMLSRETITSFDDLQEKMKNWIEYYNFRRPHQGIGGLFPADRFFGMENQVKELMKEGAVMVKEAKAAEPDKLQKTMYMVGRIGDKEFRFLGKDGEMVVVGEEKNAGQIPSGDTGGDQSAGNPGSVQQQKNGQADMPGIRDQQTDILQLGRNGDERDAASPVAAEERPEKSGMDTAGETGTGNCEIAGEEPENSRGEPAAGTETGEDNKRFKDGENRDN